MKRSTTGRLPCAHYRLPFVFRCSYFRWLNAPILRTTLPVRIFYPAWADQFQKLLYAQLNLLSLSTGSANQTQVDIHLL